MADDKRRLKVVRPVWIDGALVEVGSMIEVPRLLSFELLESNKCVIASEGDEKAKAAKSAPEKRG